jgi:hypothetical protein
MIALDHLGALAALLLQLERRLEEVHVEARGRIEPRHDLRGLDTFEAAVADQPAHHRAVLLLHERLVVLLVGARSRHLDLLCPTPRHDHIVHERAVVVEIGAAQEPGEQGLRPLDRLDHQSAVTGDERQALGPAERADPRTRAASAVPSRPRARTAKTPTRAHLVPQFQLFREIHIKYPRNAHYLGKGYKSGWSSGTAGTSRPLGAPCATALTCQAQKWQQLFSCPQNNLGCILALALRRPTLAGYSASHGIEPWRS